MENGEVREEAPEEDQRTETEDVGKPEESATESELEGNKKTEVEPEEPEEPVEPVEHVEHVEQAEQVEHEKQETSDEPESNAKDEAVPEVAAMSVEEREPESENDNDDDDEVQMGVL